MSAEPVRLAVRLAVLLSGRGSNFEAVLAAQSAGDFPAQIVLVGSDNVNAAGLQTARLAGIATTALARSDFGSKQEHETALHSALEAHDVEVVVLAGYMRLLSADFIARWENRIVNIHPSLLPAYPGLDTHARAIADGAELHGCTVHLVDAGMDTGPILAQSQLTVSPGETPEALAARVLKMEHRLYPKVIADFCERLRATR
ncbi:MAG: phosphoribosylglycinamide formyltransferase [Pseudomonadota bacterium]